MNEENVQDKNNPNSTETQGAQGPTTQSEILNDDFFSQIKTSKKISDKKKKIDELTKSIQENPSYLNSPENQQKISELYNLLISNLNENNNNYVSSQIKLIDVLINNNKDKDNQNFKNFSKQALPKLFDKYYLQNQKINDNLTSVLTKFIDNKIMDMEDYYPLIENISLEEEDNYRSNIMNLINDQIEKNKEITLDKIPKGIIDIVNRLSKDEDDDLSNIAKKSLEALDNRRQQDLNEVKEKEKEDDIKKEEAQNKEEKKKENGTEEINNNTDTNDMNDNKDGNNKDEKINEEKKDTINEGKEENNKIDNNKNEIKTNVENNENNINSSENGNQASDENEANNAVEKEDEKENEENTIPENKNESKDENPNNNEQKEENDDNNENINEKEEIKDEDNNEENVENEQNEENEEINQDKENDENENVESEKEEENNENEENKEENEEINQENENEENGENERKEENEENSNENEAKVEDNEKDLDKEDNQEDDKDKEIKQDEEEEDNKENEDNNKNIINEEENNNEIENLSDDNQMTEIPEIKIEDDLLDIDNVKVEKKEEIINNDNNTNVKENEEKDMNENNKEKIENGHEIANDNNILNEPNNKIEDKEENNQEKEKKEEITENKIEEVNKSKEEESQKIKNENEKNKETNKEDSTNQNIEKNESIKVDENKNNEKVEIINDNKPKDENIINNEENKTKNEESNLDSNKNENETEKKENNNNSTNEEQKTEKIETNNENKEKIENKENNVENKKEEVPNIKDNNEKKEENNNEIKDNKEIEKKDSNLENNNKSENKESNNIEKKESNNEIKDENNVNPNTTNNSESKKDGGVKRSVIPGKLNKFRKQFGKTKKSKKIESSKELDKSSNKKDETKEDNKEEKKENNIKDTQSNNIANSLNNENKNLNVNDPNNNVEKKIIENINNMNDNDVEIKRTNTLEEMFKKKIEDGFDTETNNILDLGKSHNNKNDSNVLNDIQDKLGINFNDVINLNNNSNNNDNQDKKDNINNNNTPDKKEINNKENIDKKDSNTEKTELKTDDKHDSKQFINPDDRPIHPSTSNIFDSKNYIDPDDRPIHPSTSKNFNFDLDFEEQEKLLQIKDKEIKERKMKKLNTTRPKNLFEDKDLDELGKMDFSKKTSSKNGSSSNKKFISEEIDNRKIKPFVIENNNEAMSKDAKEINTTLNNINETINSLSNLNLIKKNNDDERRPRIKIDDFQKKLELALEQEHEQGEGDAPNPEENSSSKKEKSNKMEEDPRFDKIKEILGKEIVDSLFSQKWESKKHGYELINSFLETNTGNDFNTNDLFEYIRLKLKNFKETNFNVNREAMNVFITMTKKKLINKENLISVVMTYYDKITDSKLKDNYLELLNSSLSIVEPNTIIKQLLPKITKKNNVKLFIEYSLFLGKIIEEYSNKELPYKEMTNFCKVMANNNNPQSRNAGTNLICILYKYYGEDVHKLILDIKESTLKNIEGELSKITIIEKKNSSNLKSRKSITKSSADKSYNKNLNGNGGVKELNGAENGEPKPNVAIDISKKITPQILKDISDGKWAEKKDACEQVEKILAESNMKILPNGLNDLMNLIKKKLTDGNKNIVRMMVNLLTELIEALKHGFKQWSKYIAPNLIPNLSDKNQILRNECQICFDKWVEFVGFDTLIIYFPSYLKNDNVEIRTEIMNFINKYKNKFTKEIGVQVFKEMASNLLLCLQDRSSSVRSQAEETIKLSLNYIKLNIYYDRAKEYKPAITKDLTLILDKIQNELNGNNSTTNESNSNVSNNKNNNNNNNNDDNVDIENESNININELISSNSNSNNKKNTNGNGASTNRTNHHKSNSTAHKKEDSGYLKSNSTILGSNNNIDSNLNINETMNKKYKKSTNKIKSRKSLNTSTVSLSSASKSKEKNSSIEKRHKTKELPSYKTCSNFNKKKNTEKEPSTQKLVKKDTTKLLKTVEKKPSEEKRPSLAKTVNPKGSENAGSEKPSLAQKLGFSKIKGISHSLILKKTDKKSKKDMQVFTSNIKVVPNKAKRLEKDLKIKFSLEYISKDSSIKTKLKDTCKNLFVDDFSQKIFSDDFKNQASALKEMKEQLDKKINVPIYFDNLDLILKIVGIKVNGNTNPTLVKNLFEFLESLYIVIKEKGQALNEIESNIIISILIDKLSIINISLKESLYRLLNSYIELFGADKIMLVVLNIGLGKNSKIKNEILDYTFEMIGNMHLNIKNKNYVKILGKYLCVNDNTIKGTILTLFKEIYSELKEDLFIILDFLPDKEREYLESNLYVEDMDDEEEEVEINKNYHIGMNSSDEDEEDNQDNNNNDNNNNDNNNKDNNNNYNNNNDNNKHEKEKPITNQIIANGAEITQENFLKLLNNLLSDNSKEQINVLVSLNDFAIQKYEANKKFLNHNIDNILKVFIQVFKKLFANSDLSNLNMKSTKYTSGLLLKFVQNKEMINNVSYNVLYELSIEILNFLLLEDINKFQDGMILVRTINSSMLRLIENCDKNDMLLILLENLKNSVEKENKKMRTLTLRCLMKFTENLKEFINELNLNQILTQLHLIIYQYDILYPNLNLNMEGKDDQFIIKFLYGFIGTIINLKGENEIMEIYNNSIKKNKDLEDKYIIHWIKSNIKHNNEKNTSNINNKAETSNSSNNNSNSEYNTNSINDNNKSKIKDDKSEDNKKDNEKNMNDEEGNNNKKDNGNDKGKMIEELKNKWNNVKPK